MPYWSTLYLASKWAIRFVMLVYVPQRPAAAARTWLLLIFLLPWPGLVIYALFGRIRVPRARIEQQMLASQRIVQAQLQQREYFVCDPELPSCLAHIPGLAARLGDFGAFAGNAVELIPDYADSQSRETHAGGVRRFRTHPDRLGRHVRPLRADCAYGWQS